jgi:hypothetical protein
MKSGEMMLASAQVIAHRTGRMARAGAIPNARDRKEFTLMGQEKIEAAAASAQAMGEQMMKANWQWAMLAYRQWMGSLNSLAALTTRTSVPAGKRHARLMRYAMLNPTEMAAHFSGSIARLAHHGLKPIHSRATGNAKRLGNLK